MCSLLSFRTSTLTPGENSDGAGEARVDSQLMSVCEQQCVGSRPRSELPPARRLPYPSPHCLTAGRSPQRCPARSVTEPQSRAGGATQATRAPATCQRTCRAARLPPQIAITSAAPPASASASGSARHATVPSDAAQGPSCLFVPLLSSLPGLGRPCSSAGLWGEGSRTGVFIAQTGTCPGVIIEHWAASGSVLSQSSVP